MKPRSFVKARDGSRRPVRGLYIRDKVFYARLNWNGKEGWYRLEKATDVESAKREKVRFESLRDQGLPPPSKQVENTKTFGVFSEEYLKLVAHTKKARTIKNEQEQIRGILNPFFWKMDLNKIFQRDVEEFRAERLKNGLSNRTVNHNVIVFRNVIKKAKAFGYISSDPTAGISPLKLIKKSKTFLPIESIRQAASWIRENVREGEVIANAVLFLAFTGARRTEGLAVRWEDVDFKQERVCIGATGDTKNRDFRFVDFYPDLKDLLITMKGSNEKPSGYLFPTYRTPNDAEPEPLKDIREAIKLAREELKQDHWSPHDLRHHFASRCVMAGVDFKQIAEWLGHKDGGMLVATVYGHLAAGHGKVQAAKLGSSSVTV